MSDWTNYNGVMVPTVDPPLDDAGYYLKYNFITLADSTLAADGTTIVNNSGVLSAEKLTDGSQIAVDGVNRVAKATGGSTTTIDWSAGLKGYDSAGLPSVDANNRSLISDSGQATVSWEYGQANDYDGVESIHWGARELYDTSASPSINWHDRYLFDTTPSPALDYANYLLINGGNTIASWSNGFAGRDHGGYPSLDCDARHATIANGTVVLSWDDSGLVPLNVGNSLVVVSDGSGHLTTSGVTTTPTELNYVHGVTSAIQAQLNALAPVSSTFAFFTGTAYTLTGTAAAVVGGTTSPTLTLSNNGACTLKAKVQVELVGATFAANQTLAVKIRRTNNTPADVASSTVSCTLPIVTTLTQTLAQLDIEVPYTATNGDVVTIFAGLSATPAAGSVTISAGQISVKPSG